MKRLTITLLALVTAIFVFPVAKAERIANFETLSGIPVMEGLEEDLTQRVVFDKAEGRIIRTILVGNVAPAEAAAFYREVLFQLGWVEEASGAEMTFIRDEEVLTLSFSGTETLLLTISLKPLS